MVSLHTNASAQTALTTLSATSKSLAATQKRVSTGFRINTAEDNAAYWSIATTLRSDVNALGAVKDALGLGAATVDTVYTGINDTKDLLDQVKSKLVAASQSGVPKKQVQAEISQLQNRLNDTSKSTVINSESWLTQDSTAPSYTSQKDTVGSFTRGTGGVITIENITIDIKDTKLYEAGSTKHTAANTALNNTSSGALQTYSNAVAAATSATGALGANRTAALAAVKLTVNGTTGVISATAGGGGVVVTGPVASTATNPGVAGSVAITGAAVTQLGQARATELATAINKVLTELGASKGHAAQDGVGALKDYDITGGTPNASVVAGINGLVAGAQGSIDRLVTDAYAAASKDQVNAAIDAYQASANGTAANSELGIFDKIRSVVSNSDGTGARAVRVSDIDISSLGDTDFDKAVLTAYIEVVDDALQELTTSAAIIGAAKARIGGNQTFVQNLIDANERGIGQLVDADLNAESSKLKAQQVQEQLAVQALGIANNSTQSILSLFQ